MLQLEYKHHKLWVKKEKFTFESMAGSYNTKLTSTYLNGRSSQKHHMPGPNTDLQILVSENLYN